MPAYNGPGERGTNRPQRGVPQGDDGARAKEPSLPILLAESGTKSAASEGVRSETDATAMYPPSPQDACFDDLQLQLAPPPPPAVETPAGDEARERPEHGELPLGWRVSLIAVAVVLVLVGVAGLFLPGLQGIVTILAGVALLSLVSQAAHRFLRWSLGPWPKLLDRVESLRLRLHDWLHCMREKLTRRRTRRRSRRREPAA